MNLFLERVQVDPQRVEVFLALISLCLSPVNSKWNSGQILLKPSLSRFSRVMRTILSGTCTKRFFLTEFQSSKSMYSFPISMFCLPSSSESTFFQGEGRSSSSSSLNSCVNSLLGMAKVSSWMGYGWFYSSHLVYSSQSNNRAPVILGRSKVKCRSLKAYSSIFFSTGFQLLLESSLPSFCRLSDFLLSLRATISCITMVSFYCSTSFQRQTFREERNISSISSRWAALVPSLRTTLLLEQISTFSYCRKGYKLHRAKITRFAPISSVNDAQTAAERPTFLQKRLLKFYQNESSTQCMTAQKANTPHLPVNQQRNFE